MNQLVSLFWQLQTFVKLINALRVRQNGPNASVFRPLHDFFTILKLIFLENFIKISNKNQPYQIHSHKCGNDSQSFLTGIDSNSS